VNDALGTFPLMCFRAGDATLGVAAEEVIAVEVANPAAVYIGVLMGIQAERSLRYQRTIWLDDGGAVVELVVDSPVRVHRIRPRDVLPIAPGLPLVERLPLLGFARVDERLALLLDTKPLIEALHERRRGATR
jgi:chemotaxis signal transduction protein